MSLTRPATLLIAALLVAAPVEAQMADPADVESIDALITAVYDVISGDAGEERDWDRWNTLFAEGATLSAIPPTGAPTFRRNIMTPESYPELVGEILMRDGFHEVEIGRTTEMYGQIAHAFSTYESRRAESDPEPFDRGINSFQFMNDGERWWVVSIFWQAEGPQNPIPDRYIGK